MCIACLAVYKVNKALADLLHASDSAKDHSVILARYIYSTSISYALMWQAMNFVHPWYIVNYLLSSAVARLATSLFSKTMMSTLASLKFAISATSVVY